jgi:hypothetical protein
MLLSSSLHQLYVGVVHGVTCLEGYPFVLLQQLSHLSWCLPELLEFIPLLRTPAINELPSCV